MVHLLLPLKKMSLYKHCPNQNMIILTDYISFVGHCWNYFGTYVFGTYLWARVDFTVKRTVSSFTDTSYVQVNFK